MRFKLGILGFLAAAGGILTAAACEIGSLIWLLAGLWCIALALIRYLLKYRMPWWMIPVCFFLCGGFLFGLRRETYRAELRWNQPFTGKTTVLEGVQIERTVSTRYGYRFLFQVKPATPGGPVGRISVTSREPLPLSGYGHYLKVAGRFKAVVQSSAAWPDTMERQRVSGICYSTGRPQLVKNSPRHCGLPFYHLWAERLRGVLMGQGSKILKPANTRLLHGMIYNDRLDESDDAGIVADMRRTGTIHLLSVSGLHIGFIVMGLNFILGWLRCPSKWRMIPLSIGVWFYILMTGMDPPVLRAGLMMLLFFAGELLGSNDSNLNRLSLAALILTLLNPCNLFDIGFQLSFLATLGVVWIYPLLREYFPVPPDMARYPLVKPIWEGMLVSFGAQSLVIPVIINYFQMISWAGTLVNLLLLIPAEVIVMGGFAGELLGVFIPWAGRVVLIGIDGTLNLSRFILNFFGNQPWSASMVPRWPWPWFAAYYLGMAVALDWLRPNRLTGKRMIKAGALFIMVLVALNGAVWAVYLDKSVNNYLQVSCLDVGQGDSIFVKTPDGFTALIDGGDEGKGRRDILPFLRQMGVSRLDLVIGTHGHKDHVGGLPEVLPEIPAREAVLPLEDIPDMRDLLACLSKIKIVRVSPEQSRKFKLGHSVTLEIMEALVPESENDQSLVTVIHYEKEKLLLTGDLGFEGETFLMRKYPHLLRASFLKVGHHGSNYSTSMTFLARVRPKLAVISAGAGNQFGHPGSKTLNRLRSMGVRVYRTDKNGRVDVRVSKGRWVIWREK
jgi:competence protein ComEC